MKNKKQVDIIGRTVMVHPQLTTDPVQRQGEIGQVTDISLLYPEVLTVTFSDGKRAAYMSDGLITLYPKPLILQGYISNDDLPILDRETILEVYRLMTTNKMTKALKLARSSEAGKFFCTTTADKWIELKQQKNKHIKKGKKL